MLINIDPVLSPNLLYHLRSMGHGEKLILVDANFSNRYSTTNFPVNEVAPQIIISNCFIYPKIKKNGYTTCSITV